MNLESFLANFPLILLILTIVTGVVWFFDVFYLAKKRKEKAQEALAEFDKRQEDLIAKGVIPDAGGRDELEESILKRPTWVEYSGSFFPVIFAVFFLRSFLFEPFKIPSSSMLPTLEAGDLILVNKFTYGIRLPVINKKIIGLNEPKRGEVMVFKYPKDTSQDYIKRVIGVPGDTVVYRNKRLSVNGRRMEYKPLPDYLDSERLAYSKQFEEEISGVNHGILNVPEAPAYVPHHNSLQFPNRSACAYDAQGFICKVPQGHYFVMGDNRDNSLDSRYWGFVPDNHIVGKAFLIWMNLNGEFKRIGSFE